MLHVGCSPSTLPHGRDYKSLPEARFLPERTLVFSRALGAGARRSMTTRRAQAAKEQYANANSSDVLRKDALLRCLTESGAPSKWTPVLLPFRTFFQEKDKLCRTVEALCSGNECNAMIALTNKIGYEDALLGVGQGQQMLAPSFQ